MNELGVAIFVLSYVGIALGEIPGLAIDRTGVALLGAMLLVASETLTFGQATAAIDAGTLVLLFGLMVLSAQFRLGGFYSAVAIRAARSGLGARGFLAFVIAASAVLSALLSNDVICLVMTPIVLEIVVRRGWNPLPFLLALAAAANVGSAATVIGNPQNMFIGQKAGLDFARFFLWCAPPSLASLALLFAWLARGDDLESEPAHPHARHDDADWPLDAGSMASTRPFDRAQSAKAVALTIVLVALFFTRVPREVSVLGVVAVLMLSRKLTTPQFLALVDWPLLLLFIGLFVLIEGFRVSGGMVALEGLLARSGLEIHGPAVLAVASVVLSNVVSNVPAVMLLMAEWPANQPELAYLLALTSTYAGNLLLIGSIANLIVAEQARAHGTEIGFKLHARRIAPFAVVSLVIAVAWWWGMTRLVR
ncbi:MAG: anion transporter [Deltaproteobacteria bacterium]|nr:anion transporter [Deltaproteobacteria bacterium]